MRDILDTVNTWIAADRPIALATVAATWGSAPRAVGAHMAIAPDGDSAAIAGSVSGGCVEAAVIREALEVIADGTPRLLHFGVSDDQAWDVGLACGGQISVLVERLDGAWWTLAAARMTSDLPTTTLTLLDGDHIGAKALYDADGLSLYSAAGFPHESSFADAVIAARRATRATIAGHDLLLDTSRPRPHLIVVGGAHVALLLAEMGLRLDYRVTVIDPRRVFATPERFPAPIAITHEYPDRAFARIGLDADSYIAVLTHDPKIDDKALIAALPSAARYVGVMSSRKTHAARLERLRAAGIDDGQIARIHTPIGIDIGASTPEEIALSIMAQIVAVRRAK